ncbi:MAG TPA: hypothetical protein VKA91_08530 [Nitrososphaeraceae archaeon]|nr:hypothetical protein [Nitrososphaeraceae archaeon]
MAEHIKGEAVRKWLSGEQRDKIASDISMGAGTVTNIFRNGKMKLAFLLLILLEI